MNTAVSRTSNRIPRRARFITARGALWLFVLAGPGGCASDLATRTGEVLVTSPNGSPVPDAVVRADPIDPHHPLNIADYFKDEPASLGSWRTDSRGQARIKLLLDGPTALSFAAAGFAPDSVLIDPSRSLPLQLTLIPLFTEPGNQK